MLIAEGYSRPLSISAVPKTLPDVPIATTRERGWGGVTLDYHGPMANYAILSPAHDHILVCYCPSGSGRIVQARAGEVHDGVVTAGMALIMPAGMDSSWNGDVPASARIRIPEALVASAAEQTGLRKGGGFEIRNVFATRDDMIANVARILLSELDHPPHVTQSLIVETMSCALAVHLLRRYDASGVPMRDEVVRLGRKEIARLIEFIDANLDRTIGLNELAEQVDTSRFHFTRIFKQAVGATPIAFVEQRRIQRAQTLIADGDIPLSEIAAITGFADQSHFTRRFRLHTGCTPAAFARKTGRRRSVRSSSERPLP